MRVRFSRSADADLDNIFLHIAKDRPRAAADLVERILDATAGLADFPLTGRRSGAVGQRELTIVRPYVIVYVVRADVVEILRIYHGAQNR